MSARTRALVAERRDGQAGVLERAEYLGPVRDRIFAFTHLPGGAPRAAALICSPLYAEFTRNYRREVLMARRLAASGVAVQRFHYRGTGNSDGAPGDITFETMRRDALLALDRLRTTSEGAQVCLIGARYGGLVAGALLPTVPDALVAIWDPIVDPSRYLLDILRARSIVRLKKSDEPPDPPLSNVAEQSGDDLIDVMGYEVRRSLFQDGVSSPFLAGIRDTSGAVLLVSLGADPRRSREVQAITSALEGRAASVEVLTCHETEPWWFTSGALVRKDLLTEPVVITVGWLLGHLAEGGDVDG
jgi:hypothetical protein